MASVMILVKMLKMSDSSAHSQTHTHNELVVDDVDEEVRVVDVLDDLAGARVREGCKRVRVHHRRLHDLSAGEHSPRDGRHAVQRSVAVLVALAVESVEGQLRVVAAHDLHEVSDLLWGNEELHVGLLEHHAVVAAPADGRVAGGSTIHARLTVDGQEAVRVEPLEVLADGSALERQRLLAPRQLLHVAVNEANEHVPHILLGLRGAPQVSALELRPLEGEVVLRQLAVGRTRAVSPASVGELVPSSSPRDVASLAVGPEDGAHLLAQWKLEVDKFVKPGEIDVVLGLRQYMELVENPAARADISNRMLVLVGVEEAVKSRNHYYKHGQLYATELQVRGRPKPLAVDPIALQEYEEAAKFVHKAYSGPLWVSPLHLPQKSWRRVIFEEVQDLVLPGKSARDCFIQLTHRSLNVWLITATPFPGKAESMYANNQLLGFKRLRLLPQDPAFDEIKRKLYLRNCAQVKQQAITDKIKVDETYIPVKLHPKELLLYKIERVLAVKQSEYDVFALGDVNVLAAGGKEGTADTFIPEETPVSGKDAVSEMLWGEQYKSARQSCVHAGISDRIIERERGGKQNGSKDTPTPPLTKIKSPSEVYRDENYHLNRQLAVAKKRKNEVDVMEAATRNTVQICRAIRLNAYANVQDCFDDLEGSGLSKFFDDSGESKLGFRMLYKHYPFGDDMPEPTELLFYHQGEIEDYILKYFNTMDKVEKLAKIMESTLNERCPRARAVVEEQLKQVTECVALVSSKEVRQDDAIEKMPAYGSKIGALVQYLSRLPTIKVVIFTMWDRALRVVDKALCLANITSAVFLQHQSSETKSAHVASFHSGDIQVLILNSLTSASGINLQVASHVIFLDPVGFSPMQANK
ncbi:hypothetical protein ON010_g16567 [Phytophthora cinnamomi]|nr:hypothetical protein ON010_g16567 [Phytophthora cinnamomi]